MKDTPYQAYYATSYTNNNSIKENIEGIELLRSHIKQIKFSKNKKVLDIACGTGLLGKTFSNKVYGFDLNTQAVRVAKKNGVIATKHNAEKKWPYQSDFFDIVIASHIIEHVANPDHIMEEAKRVLKKGGLFIIATPNLAAWFNRVLLLCGFQPFFTEVSTKDKTIGISFTRKLSSHRNPLGHLRVFTYRALCELVTFHRFKLVTTTGHEFLAFPKPLLWIDRYISRIIPVASSIIVIAKKQ